MGAAVVGLAAGWGCSQSREDRAREQGHQAQENADRDLQQARDKLRQELDRAGQQTKQDLDKARDANPSSVEPVRARCGEGAAEACGKNVKTIKTARMALMVPSADDLCGHST